MSRNAFRAAFAWSTQTNAHFFTLIAGLAMLGWAAVWLALGVFPLAVLLASGTLLMGLCLWLWASRAYAWVPHLMVGSAIGVILLLVALSGGITGRLALWIYLLPIGISLLLGVRGSLLWNGLTALAVLVLAGARLTGVHLPALIPAQHALGLELASSISAVLVILLLSMFYSWSQESALRRTRASHENLAALLRSVPDAVYAVEVEEGGGEMLGEFQNEPLSAILGASTTKLRATELAGTNPAFRALFGEGASRLAEVVRTGEPARWQVRLNHPHGELLLDVRSQPLLDERGRVERIVTLTRDLSQVERLSSALAQRAEQLEVLNDVGRVLASEYSLDELYRAIYAQVGRVLRCDAFYVAIWDEARQRIRFPLMMDEGVEYRTQPDIPLSAGPTSQAIREHRTVLHEAGDARALSGSWGNTTRPSRAAIHAPMVKDGRVLGVLSVQNYAQPYDAGDVRLLETLADQAAVAVANAQLYEHLSASEARFRELTAAIARMDGHAVVVTDLEGTITFAAGTGATHGFPPESIIGQTVNVLGKNAPDADRTTAAFTRASLAERPWTQAVEATRSDGQNFPILLSCSPYYGAQGEIVGTVTIGRDLTQERWNQERLLQSAKLASVGELVAGVAHELNNPLTVIKSTAYLLGDEVDGVAGEDVRMIAEAADRAVRIVRGLLHFSRQTPARRAATQLNEVVERVLRFREDALRADGCTVVRDLAPELPEVRADSAQLEQVLLNLINNAAQAMREAGSEGRVTIRTERHADVLWLSVADTGPGIAPEVLPRIFDPFFTTRGVGEGTGLGLALSHGIITEHGGTVWAESQPGAGAVFRVELPVAAGEMPPFALEVEPPVREDRSRVAKRVLVVDDEPAIRSSVSRYLARRGHQVDEAGSGQEALQRVTAAAYDVILLDLKMVGMSGHEVYAVLCEHWPELVGCVRFATGDVVSPETIAFLAATGRPYFEKPYSLEELAMSIEADASPGSPS